MIVDKYARIEDGEFVPITNKDYENFIKSNGGEIDGRLIHYNGKNDRVWQVIFYIVENFGYQVVRQV